MSYLLATVRCLWVSFVEFVKPASTSRPAQLTEQRRSKSDSALNEHSEKGILTRDEVSKHATQDDCWIVIKNKVYDVTTFGNVHPGGTVIFTHGGRDATDVFTCFHAASTWSQLKKYQIGEVHEIEEHDTATASLLADFRQLRASFLESGMFKADMLYYLWKISLNLSILASVVSLMVVMKGEWKWFVLSAFLLGLFWQQMGWLAHDFCHHQVFKNRRLNNIAGYFCGNVLQGFSVDWWKNKHNTHHAVTNEIDSHKAAVDPDIDTLPLLAWSSDMLTSLSSPSERTLIRYQHYIFVPILLLARFSWAQQSFSHAMGRYLSGRGSLEFALVLLHYVWVFALAFTTLSPAKAVLFLLLSQALSGFMLGLSFVQSHNGMEIYGDVKDFVTAQVISTRDIAHSHFVDFFMGGLNYQIEHHLFPTMPRHNLRKAQVAVRALCEKHRLPYEECTMDVGTYRVMQRLIEVAKLA